jgi:hypothetical protein
MKLNPRRRPATQADVQKAKNDASEFAITATCAIFLSVLTDKEGYNASDIRRVWQQVNSLSESVSGGYVSIADLRKTLNEEYDILI